VIKVTVDGDLCLTSADEQQYITSSSKYGYFDVYTKNVFFSIENTSHFNKMCNNYVRIMCYTRCKLLPYFKKVIDFAHIELTIENENTEY